MDIDKNREGAWRICDIVNGYLKQEFITSTLNEKQYKKFKQEMKELRGKA